MEITSDASKASAKTPEKTPAERAALVEEIKRLLVDSVNIQHIPLNEIHDTTTLFGDGLGLDSVDVLEVVVAVERKYSLKIRDAKAGQQIFRSIGSIADFVALQSSSAGTST